MAKKRASSRSTSGRRAGAGRRSTTSHHRRTGNGRTQTHMIENLEEGFLAEVADMLHAERQILKMLPKLVESATSRKLKDAFELHLEQTEDQVMRLERVFKLFDHKPQVEVCEGMHGIITEGKELLSKTGPGPVRDAMIIAAAQKVEHYEITSYGTLCSWAEQLGEHEALDLLEQSLVEEKTTDRNLSRIAESFSNQQADGGRQTSQGRFSQQSRGWRNRDSERSRDDRFDQERYERSRSGNREREFQSFDDDHENEPRYGDRVRARSGRG